MSMFCFQCEQTFRGSGCINMGICGKDPKTAAMQDLLIHGLKGLSMYARRARDLGSTDAEIDSFSLETLFATVTNVNFDVERLGQLARRLSSLKDRAQELYQKACSEQHKTPDQLEGPAQWHAGETVNALLLQSERAAIPARKAVIKSDDLFSLQELLTYGLKGLAAYAYHAEVLGQTDPMVYSFIHQALDFLTEDHTADELTSMNLKAGEVNLRAMELLSLANTGAYGDPTPTAVRISPVKGKAILVSGHDLKDLEELLKQTEGKGINIYTHGEMLPAHGYPKLKAYTHLVGNYGGAWYEQQREFDEFPGAILMTTNCIQRPVPTYMQRIFSAGPVAFPGVTHIEGRNFDPVIKAALAAKGFAKDEPAKNITVGFGHKAVLAVADKVVQAVKDGAIKHFFLIGGCDGAKDTRSTFTALADNVPADAVVLTLGCGKYRFNKLNFGEIGGIPRLLDVGQCNDAYSAIQIASALAQAFNTDVNSLPLSLMISWYEQKAVAVLLTLLHLGIKNIRLGPTLPAFVSPGVLGVLSEKFNLMLVGDPVKDIQAAIRGA